MVYSKDQIEKLEKLQGLLDDAEELALEIFDSFKDEYDDSAQQVVDDVKDSMLFIKNFCENNSASIDEFLDESKDEE